MLLAEKLIVGTVLLCTLIQCALQNRNTGLIPEQEDPLLVFSTLEGALIGVGQRSGKIRWRQNDEPVVKVPVDLSQISMPMFLPDPRDGSLYTFGTETETLKKLPFTIPQLVANSPCRSSDGILYTGRKIDTWFTVDPKTGEREQLLGFEKVKNTCPVELQDAIFVGRTEYNIIMIDSKRKDRKWNVTFYDYSATKMENDGTDNYELVHFTTSASGRVVTINRRLGIILWELDVESPVIAMYTVSKDGLLTLPFTSVADGTLDLLLERFATKPSDIQLFPTLYVGQHGHGLYALPSLVDYTMATISSKMSRLLLEGPFSVSQLPQNNDELPLTDDHIFITNVNNAGDESPATQREKRIVTLGHYTVPAEYKLPTQPLQITGRSDPIIQNRLSLNSSTESLLRLQINESSDSMSRTNASWRKVVATTYNASKTWLNQQENKGLKLALIGLLGCIVIMFWYLNAQYKEFQQLSQGSREDSRSSDSGRHGIVIIPEDIGEGLVRVGKITFNTAEVLGKGCEGTFVYKGEFDGR